MSKKSILSKNNQEEWMEDYEGQLAIDVYETDSELILTAPIAGVSPENIDVQISDEFITIKGERADQKQAEASGYHIQECYWGAFSRSFEIPIAVDADNAEAIMKNGILTVVIPKLQKAKAKSLKIQAN
ncbi:MAG: Small heat shock protein [Berkelbacteria bacterium GW2011_GWA2_38_9]|uniref:Small heat shock protein n=1 Tax=Berkelbacteria bacterium GW2011_GWA2_38_9 TaxID=1618334 RepID=A0A0G0LNZ1_9BACT|nr:MAG: Small heat shock protein [Berkelbacteria bacterium GW2011_GWA2_38_9]